ncbi:phosphopyruvate hydratase [Anaerosacchariphilus polymeriproducens]|uniref:Enolase n=1 Tax=Anaerosacchariphilus polymeriproducens TaxID=1812858 RepID=A0A371AZ27_9FIRM|nr:phosphopyruvate hydratase [Anaerosacchariphilus polymeriproducens]RDU24811.1 phosphopyruvate hydratase [Anaerosacchariphilus polymeriproducens]
MYQSLSITKVHAREILDSRGNPTVEVEVVLEDLISAIASVPSGASTGKFEAVELRDGKKRYLGLGVQKAVENVNKKLADILNGKDALKQIEIDQLIIKADGTENKENLGANAMLGTSMAVAKAAAKALSIPLYQYLGGIGARQLPVPMMNILNGGRHADNTVDLQEFMIMPIGAKDYKSCLQMGVEVYHNLKTILKKQNHFTAVGDEGGFAPNLADSKETLSIIMEAIVAAGYEPGKDIVIALDAAASELYQEDKNQYYFPGESQVQGSEVVRSSEEMIQYYQELVNSFPIVSIEDGLHENDWDGWKELTNRLGAKVQLVGDDLFVTNVKRLKYGIERQVANAILVKVNQIGTLTEAFDTVETAHKAGYRCVISHRSGETEDSTISDIAIAVNSGQIKTGAPCRGERTAKYNQLLRIEEELNGIDRFVNPFAK